MCRPTFTTLLEKPCYFTFNGRAEKNRGKCKSATISLHRGDSLSASAPPPPRVSAKITGGPYLGKNSKIRKAPPLNLPLFTTKFSGFQVQYLGTQEAHHLISRGYGSWSWVKKIAAFLPKGGFFFFFKLL